jgi:hypothetical protein
MVRHARAAFQGRCIVGKRKVREQDPRRPATRLDAGCHARVPAIWQANADRSVGYLTRSSSCNNANQQTGKDRSGHGN